MPLDTVLFQTTALATPPAGQKVAVDNLASGAAQYVKLLGGAQGDVAPVLADTNGINVSVKTGGYALPVTGAFYQATQPVSIAGSVPVTGAFYQATQPVSIAGSVAVTGAFYQATQPVSGTVRVQSDAGLSTIPVSIAAAVSVTGAFYPATQPVSGTVSISGTVPVSGTVGVSGTVPVTGAFYQATQPISIAVPVVLGASPGTAIGTVAVSGTVTLGAAAATTIGTVNIAAGQNVGITGSVGVTGAFYQATQPVSVAAVVHVDDNGGSVTVDAPVGAPLYVRPIPGAANGWNYYANPALTNVKQQLTLAGCTIGGYVIHNPNAVTAYVLVWDIAVSGVTVGTTAPSWVIGIPAGATANVEWTLGVQHVVALTLAATPTVAGTGALATGLPMMLLFR